MIPEVPKTIEDTTIMLFGDNWKELENKEYCLAVGARVYSDIFFRKSLDNSKNIISYYVREIFDCCSYISKSLSPFVDPFIEKMVQIVNKEMEVDKKYGKEWESREKTEEEILIRKEINEGIQTLAINLSEELKKHGHLYMFEYSDNRGEAQLEHNQIFDRLKYIQISHH